MENLCIRQLVDAESSTYSYLLFDAVTKEAVIIDSVLEKVERDLKLLQELDLKLLYCLETHVHADHITAAHSLRAATEAKIVFGASAKDEVKGADLFLGDGESIRFGKCELQAIATPGHTNTCTSYLMPGFIFTGDTLFIRSNGRTDFQSGCAKQLYQSVQEKIFSLAKSTIIFPAHDYNGMLYSTVAEEMQFNRRLNSSISEKEFCEIMDNLNLAKPKKIHEAVPANLCCGQIEK